MRLFVAMCKYESPTCRNLQLIPLKIIHFPMILKWQVSSFDNHISWGYMYVMEKIKTFFGTALITTAFVFCGCRSMSDHADSHQVIAMVTLDSASGSDVHGTVKFIRDGDSTLVKAEITGLTPGKHGFHIHENGDCSAPDAMSAGGHFNPTGMPHGGPMSDMHHMGDFGNIEADASGVAHFEGTFHNLSFEGTNSVIGRAIIVHAKADDLVSQPSGNAGARVACGVIEAK
jgi:Cu-Zn family superoxide dismutase